LKIRATAPGGGDEAVRSAGATVIILDEFKLFDSFNFVKLAKKRR
jgi:hypothetical protein